MSRFLVLATSALMLWSCSCPPAPTLQRYPDWDFTTPEGCLEYFRMAVAERDAYHLFLCLSTDVKRRKKLRLDVAHTFFDEFLEDLENQVGPVEDIEIGEPVIAPERPWLAQVRVSGDNDKAETVTLVKEVSVYVTYADPDKESEWIVLPYGDDVATATERYPQLKSPDVYRVEYERGWRIDGVTGTTIEVPEELRNPGN